MVLCVLQVACSYDLMVTDVEMVTISGWILDKDGNAVPEANVEIWDTRCRLDWTGTNYKAVCEAVVQSDKEGYFEVEVECSVDGFTVSTSKIIGTSADECCIKYKGSTNKRTKRNAKKIKLVMNKTTYDRNCEHGKAHVAVSPYSMQVGDTIYIRSIDGWTIVAADVCVVAFYENDSTGAMTKCYEYDYFYRGNFDNNQMTASFVLRKVRDMSNNLRSPKTYIRVGCSKPEDGLYYYYLPIELIGSGVEPLVPLEEFYGQ